MRTYTNDKDFQNKAENRIFKDKKKSYSLNCLPLNTAGRVDQIKEFKMKIDLAKSNRSTRVTD